MGQQGAEKIGLLAKVTELLSSGSGYELTGLAAESGLTLTLHCPMGACPCMALDPSLGRVCILAPHSVVFIHLLVLSCWGGVHEILYSFYISPPTATFHSFVGSCMQK